jgi:hypothetical protein
VVCALAVIGLATVPIGASGQSANLLGNPGAENGPGGSDSSGGMPPSGWTVSGDETVVQYGASGGFPSAQNSSQIGGGANFFAGGNDATSTATQDVNVSSIISSIDGGTDTATLSADLGGFDTQNDSAMVVASFLNVAGTELGSLTIGPVTETDRNGTTELLPRSGSAKVPVGTRTIRVVLTSTRTDGTYNDGYADNLSLTLDGPGSTTLVPPPPPPPVLFTSENVRPVSGQVFVKLPGTASGARAHASLSKGTGFIPLTQARQVPVGSILDTTRGTVGLTAASATKGQLYTGAFAGGVFQMLQNRSQKGLTQLTLMDTLNRRKVCASVGKGARATAAARKVSNKVLGLLKSTDHGRFATRGSYSSATVRGTQYSVQDTCAGTLTTVQRGSVVVDYFRRHKSVVVTAGHAFLAKVNGGQSAVFSIGKKKKG